MTLALALAAGLLMLLVLPLVFRQVIQPALRSAQRQAQRHVCEQQVERLVQAMHAYEADHGSFPPAFSVDEQGAPLHSWRVLLLPYLGSEAREIYAQLRPEEPWDSPHNRAYAARVPETLVCPHDRPSAVGDTSYCVFVGREYAFRSGSGLRRSDIVDDASTTLLIVETHKSRINWMRPADTTAADLLHGIHSAGPGTDAGDHQPGTVTVGTLDGQARPLPVTTNPLILHQMATVNGGESPQPQFAR